MTEIGYGSRAVAWDKSRNVGGAIHKIDAGKKTDMMFHTRLTKVLYLLGGSAIVRAIRDGQVKNIQFEPGSSVSIPPGFMYQLEASTEAIVVEFVNDPSSAYGGVEGEAIDVHVVSKGSTPVLDLPEDDMPPAIVMTEADKAELESKEKSVKKTTRKKRTSKKRKTK